MTFLEWCEKNQKEYMAEEWFDKLSPNEISYGATINVRWRCKFGHIWEESPNKRTSKGGKQCPYCAHRRVWKGFNDLESQKPNLISEWDFDRNRERPDEIYVNSTKKVNWICEKGHRWKAVIKDRTKENGTGCPICSNTVVLTGYNDLKKVFPLLGKQYSDKNLIEVDRIYCKSTKSVWWICEKGHEYRARIVDRVSGNGCPYCAGKKIYKGYNDLASQYPNVANEWDYEKNDTRPEEILVGSTKRVWWKCKQGHSWNQVVYVRTKQGTGCPYCAGELVVSGVNDLKTKAPWLAMEWDYNKNDNLLPENIMPHSGKKVHWICPLGHKFVASPNDRSAGRGCPICAKELHTSFPEQAIFYYFKKVSKNVKNRYIIGGFEMDIFLPEVKMAIEYDGMFYHRGKVARERENRKNEYCEKNGIKLYRVKEVNGFKANNDNVFYRCLPDNGEELDLIIIELIKIFMSATKLDKSINVNSNRDHIHIWSQYILSYKENSLESRYPQIARDWDYEKNGGILPSNVTAGSHKRLFWKCNNGHSYEATIEHRVLGTGCPYCANKKVLAGFNDLSTLRPDISAEWDYDKNGDMLPSQYTQYSGKKAWWLCSKGHSYLAEIRKRSNGRGCPYCSNKKVLKGYNDILTTNKEQALDWDYEANDCMPDELTKGHTKKVHWICHRCGYKWFQSPYMVIYRGFGCPNCSK